MQSQKLAMLVILYNKSFEESETLISIANFEKKIHQLVIVNNGPSELKEEDTFFEKLKDKHVNVNLNNYVENRPLSWIYNEFIENYDSDYYIFLDDDTQISKNNESYIFSLVDIDLELPKIIAISDKKQYYPIVNGLVFKKNGEINKFSNIFSIGSGLIISKNIKNIFKIHNENLFDERFALYGVDMSFFRKLNSFNKENINIKVNSEMLIDHSLSRTEGEISDWRLRERLYDEVITIKHYLDYKSLRLIKCVVKQISRGNWKNLKLIFDTYYNGYHPRCKAQK